jgi:hypothetical protein
MIYELEKYVDGFLIMPCVVDCINYEKQLVIDVIQDKTMMFKKGDEIKYNGDHVRIHKKLKDYPIQTQNKIENRTDIRKARYYCQKISRYE